MKLQLDQKSGIQILGITGPLDAHSFQVLHAGIQKFFRDGKNRLVLNLKDVSDLPQDMIQAIIKLNETASELSGKVSIVIENDTLRKKIESFRSPSPLSCYSELDPAVYSLLSTGMKSVVPPPDGVTPGVPRTHAALEQEILRLKEEIQKKEGGETLDLRKENEKLKDLVKSLEEKVQELQIIRRSFPDRPSLESQIKVLEERLEGYADAAFQTPSKS